MVLSGCCGNGEQVGGHGRAIGQQALMHCIQNANLQQNIVLEELNQEAS